MQLSKVSWTKPQLATNVEKFGDKDAFSANTRQAGICCVRDADLICACWNWFSGSVFFHKFYIFRASLALRPDPAPFQQKFFKNLRIQHDLESKKFKFLNLQVKNKKKLGVTFWKKCIFAKISLFLGYFSGFLFRGPKHLSWVTLCHARKKIRVWTKKLQFFFC